ncbi:bZIP transcription factor [Gracilaria domingensis]|nr:bZIP transcription factor [Gracilaria domingensis]
MVSHPRPVSAAQPAPAPAPAAAAVPDDDLYSIVASSQPSLARFSHPLPAHPAAPIPVYPQPPLATDPSSKRHSLSAQPSSHHHAAAAAAAAAAAGAAPPAPPAVSHKTPTPLHLSLLHNPPSLSVASPVSLALSTSVAHTRYSPKRKPVRSAVEEARLRAQREAETFAESRRPKRDAPLITRQSDVSSWGEQPAKRLRTDDTPRSSDRDQPLPKGAGDESEVEKQQRYKRRLDMNRESAAVSRVRRRAYVKELEERLAAVEAEKLQLEGKLEIMLSQNESFKKQLEHLFMMVAGQRRTPPYASSPSAAATQQQHPSTLPVHPSSHPSLPGPSSSTLPSRTAHTSAAAHHHAPAPPHNTTDGM